MKSRRINLHLDAKLNNGIIGYRLIVMLAGVDQTIVESISLRSYV
jgi:hypothetical protein